MKTNVLAMLAWLCLVPSTHADNWGHWRGPTGNGVATNATPPTKWSPTENIKWKVAIPGRGSGSPVVWEDSVFVTTAVPTDRATRIPTFEFVIFCLDRKDGEIRWSQTAVVAMPHEGTHETNGFASASPCTDGQHVYAHFGSRGLYCYTMDGNLVWSKDDFGQMQTRNTFGEGSSPTIAGDKILVPWDHDGQSAIYALNKLTGETIWMTPRDEPTCWATPLVAEFAGKKQVIMNGQKFARAYDLETGKEIWRCAGQTERPVASAVADQDFAYVGSGHRGSFLGAFRMDGKGDIQGTKSVAWTINRDTPDIGSPLLSSGRIYFYKGKSGQLSCVDAKTGKPHYMASRVAGVETTYASPVAAGGFVFLTDRNGTTAVIKDANELSIVAKNSVGEPVDATPAPVGNELFLRGDKHLFCISAKK
ncbi:MAG: PQQ-binding-like beta-propeller repeat protein [Planctomycetota bacterium]|nr:PQQ-binding-like beta-propeller repeat protein [Planctomycetota bacterium]